MITKRHVISRAALCVASIAAGASSNGLAAAEVARWSAVAEQTGLKPD